MSFSILSRSEKVWILWLKCLRMMLQSLLRFDNKRKFRMEKLLRWTQTTKVITMWRREVMVSSELIAMAKKLEARDVPKVGAGSLPDFHHHLHAFQAELHRDQMKGAKQTMLHSHGLQ
jgi:hypothetical protein